MSLEKLKWAAILSFVVSMAFLLLGGLFTKDRLPPYPGKVVDPAGKVLFTKADILAGQDVYQRYGLMDHGSVWGHGSQRGPEFSANTLHLQGDAVKGYLAKREYGTVYEALDDTRKEIVDLKTKREFKTNRYDPATDTLTLTPAQVLAVVFFAIQSGPQKSDFRSPAFSTGPPGWPLPLGLERITPIRTTGPMTEVLATFRPLRPISGASPVFCRF
jgi:nitric oxide reductase large subunit